MTRHHDAIVERARVWTDGARVPGADAVAIADGRIVAVGTSRELAAGAGSETVRIDAHGATLTPGLTDAHLHLVEWARRTQLDLLGCADRAAAVSRVRAFAAASDAPVIVGRGFDPNGWAEAPERGVLDAIVDDRPVLLHAKDFHSLWVNGAALRAAGVGRDTPDPPGGRVVRDGAGEPTGWLMEHATRLVAGLVRWPSVHEDGDAAAVRAAIRALHAAGITSVHDFEGPDATRLLRRVAAESGTPLRVLAHLAHSGLDGALAAGIESGIGDDRWRIGAVKLFADGTLGSRTAALLEPYDGETHAGMDLMPPDALAETVARAVAGGLSVAIHAIGDRAVRSALDAFAGAADGIAALALPPRIEHVQLAAADDLPRFAALGVAASMQPAHCVADIDLARRHWSTRVDRSYPWRALRDARAVLAFGSDAPVEPPSVATGLRAAVTRTRSGDRDPFVAAQRLTLDDALLAYTAGPAKLAGAWPRLGTVRPGAQADLVVWDRDLHDADPDTLDQARPAATLLGGVLLDAAANGAPRAAMAAGETWR